MLNNSQDEPRLTNDALLGFRANQLNNVSCLFVAVRAIKVDCFLLK